MFSSIATRKWVNNKNEKDVQKLVPTRYECDKLDNGIKTGQRDKNFSLKK